MKFNLNIEKINYVKIEYKDKENNICNVKAVIKYINENNILACAKLEEYLNIETPQNITIYFINNEGLYKTTTSLKYIKKETPYILFVIKTPEEIEYRQDREYFRVQMKEKAILSYKYKNYLSQVTCYTHDISANGVRLVLQERINIPEETCIDLFFDSTKITLKAKFIRFDNDENILKASFKFINPSENTLDFISQKCIQKQLEQKRKSFS